MKARQRRLVSLGAGLLMVLSSAVLAETGAVGRVEVEGGELFIIPGVSYAELRVTVAGEGVYWQKRFSSAERASVSLSEIGVVSDRSYGYEIVAAPEVDEEVWEAADGDEVVERQLEAQEAAKTFMQQGGFEIVSGRVVMDAPRNPRHDDAQQQATY